MRLGGDGYATEDLSQERLNNLEQGQAVPERREGFLREHDRVLPNTPTHSFGRRGICSTSQPEWGAHAPPRVVFGALAEHILESATMIGTWRLPAPFSGSARRRPLQPGRLRSPDAGGVPWEPLQLLNVDTVFCLF